MNCVGDGKAFSIRPSESHLETGLLILSDVQGQGRALPNGRISHHSRWRPGPLTQSEGLTLKLPSSVTVMDLHSSLCAFMGAPLAHCEPWQDLWGHRDSQATLSWYMRLAALATSEPMTRKPAGSHVNLNPVNEWPSFSPALSGQLREEIRHYYKKLCF